MKTLQKFKAVIFDFDGVIVSTDQYHFLSWVKLAEKEGIEFTEEDGQRLRGVTRNDSLDMLLEKATKQYTKAEKKAMLDYKNHQYLTSLQGLTSLNVMPGVIEFIEFLKDKRIKVAVGSSSKNTRLILHQIGLHDDLDAIVDGNDIHKSKPNPEVFLKVADLLKVNPEECMVIEDAIVGIHAAKSAKMFAVAISDALKSKNADLYITDYDSLQALF